jgi:hypothetical protein
MNTQKLVEKWLPKVICKRIKGPQTAGAVRLSLPIPRGAEDDLVLAGISTQREPVAYWSEDGQPGAPRRVILYGVPGGAADSMSLESGSEACGDYCGPEAEIVVIDEKKAEVALPYEINELVLRMGDRWLGIRVGLQTDEGINWWQWVTTETTNDGPVCRSVRAMGPVPVHFEVDSDIPKENIHNYQWLHRHNHVRGEVFARCYANGVVELFARHVNGYFFTEGGDLKGVVPVLGFRALDVTGFDEERKITGPQHWDFGGVSLDTTDAASLLGEDCPGRCRMEGDVLVYQPYAGVEPFAGYDCECRTGDTHLCRAEDRVIPKGIARTVRMTASLSDAPPEVGVYVAPEWWYGVCEEYAGKPLLPVRDESEPIIRESVQWLMDNCYKNSFDDGAICRSDIDSPDKPGEPGWEGEAPYGLLLASYFTQDADTYDLAMRTAYHFTDVAVDHAFTSVRMHAYETGPQSLPMQRIMASFGLYMETGDPYLADTALAIVDHAYWWDTAYFPRRSYGRDAAYIRGLTFLHRFTGEGFYLRRARKAIGRVIATQLPDGSWTDQGNTTGMHGTPNLIVKPWMGLIAAEPMVDYLTLIDDAEVAASVIRFTDWLLTCKVTTERGTHWTYQMTYGGTTVYISPEGTLQLPSTWVFHVEYLAKVMGWASLYIGKRDYYDSWYDSFSKYNRTWFWDHGSNKSIQNLLWQRSIVWDAKLGIDGVTADPQPFLKEMSPTAKVISPLGDIEVSS